MGYIIPHIELRKEDIISLRNRALDLLADMIRRSGKLPEEFQVRNILPTDFGLANDRWIHSYAAANTEETIVNTTLGDNIFAVFYGVAIVGTPRTYKLLFKSKAVNRDVVQLQAIHALEEKLGYFRDPIGYYENSSLIITGVASSIGDEELVPLGFIAEKKGETYVKI